MNLSVIIPSYNEQVNPNEIGGIFTNLGYNVQVLISTDDFHKGKGFAIKDAIALTTGDYVLFMDADMQVNPTEINTFFKLMDLYNAEVVIGNKSHSYSNSQYTFLRKIISIGYYLLVKGLFGLPLQDTQCGFKLFKHEILLKLLPLLKENRYAFDLELLVSLRDNNIRVIDSPVEVRKQLNKGSVSFGTIWITFWDTLRVWQRRNKDAYIISSK